MGENMPTKLDKYDVREEINRGSMGIVYLGHDPYENIQVAIKVASSDFTDTPNIREKKRKLFFNEIHTAGCLKHPNIVGVIDAGVEEGAGREESICYIVMEYISGGRTIRDLIDPEQPPSVKQVVEIGFKCAKALHYAHGRGVIHQDIKPTNILMTENGNVKVGDFGIAHMQQGEGMEERTRLAGMVGSPRYMSPEQIREEKTFGPSDLYSLGVVMYELLTGVPPFTGKNISILMRNALENEALPPKCLRDDIPDRLNDIVMKCISKDPDERYQSGQDLAADMSRVFDHLGKLGEKIEEQERLNLLRGLAFFEGFQPAQIREIYHAGSWQAFASGDEIIAEGTIDDCFFIIVAGKVEVKKGTRLIRTLQRGDCFGEMGYLTGTRRSASIFSRDDASLLKISSTSVSKVSSQSQIRFLKVFLRVLIRRLSATTAKTVAEG